MSFQPRHCASPRAHPLQAGPQPRRLFGNARLRRLPRVQVEIDARKRLGRDNRDGLVVVLANQPCIEEPFVGLQHRWVRRQPGFDEWCGWLHELGHRARCRRILPHGLIGHDLPQPVATLPEQAERGSRTIRPVDRDRRVEVVEHLAASAVGRRRGQRPERGVVRARHLLRHGARHTVDRVLILPLVVDDPQCRIGQTPGAGRARERLPWSDDVVDPLHPCEQLERREPAVERLAFLLEPLGEAIVGRGIDVGHRQVRLAFDQPRPQEIVDGHVDGLRPGTRGRREGPRRVVRHLDVGGEHRPDEPVPPVDQARPPPVVAIDVAGADVGVRCRQVAVDQRHRKPRRAVIDVDICPRRIPCHRDLDGWVSILPV